MKNIVKTTVLTLLITAIVLSLSGCLFSLGTSVIFTVDGEIWERNFSSDPDNAKPVIAPEKTNILSSAGTSSEYSTTELTFLKPCGSTIRPFIP